MIFINKKKVLPGFGITLVGSLLFITLILLLPLATIFIQLSKMSFIEYWKIITNPQVIASYRITFFSAVVATIFNASFGLLMAWILTRYNFPGKNIIDGIIDLPFALPTAVAGLTLAKLFSINGWYGSILSSYFNIKISYTWIGITIAMSFTSLPFVVRTIQPVLEELNSEYEEAAKTLGANSWINFFQIILPEIKPAFFIGTILSFIRSLGEFGSIILISSNIPWKTEVISLLIFSRLQEFNYSAASAISSVILLFSLFLLFFISIIQNRYSHRLGEK